MIKTLSDISGHFHVLNLILAYRNLLATKFAARKFLVIQENARCAPRRMALTAMSEVTHEIGAPVPLLILRRISLESGRLEIQRLPAAGGQPRIHVPGEVVFGALVAHRLEAEQIGLDGEQILASGAGIGCVRKRWKVVLKIS